jgi:hypothetical protein
MSFIEILEILGSLTIGFIFGKWYVNSKKPEVLKRRGVIFGRSYTNASKGQYSVDIEIEEIESTSKQTKVRVLNISFFDSSFTSQKNNLIQMTNNSWVDTSEIEWIQDSIEEKRDKKIDEILK